jgi:hypothetical protein
VTWLWCPKSGKGYVFGDRNYIDRQRSGEHRFGKKRAVGDNELLEWFLAAVDSDLNAPEHPMFPEAGLRAQLARIGNPGH